MSIDIDKCIEKLMRCELLGEVAVNNLCNRLKEHLISQSNVQQIQSPVTIVGDVHGQFYDLKELFRVGGSCPNTNYLFLGDYVDRGYYCVETISLLICLKLRWPNRITLLRGNHESREITQVYGFYAECLRKYGSVNVWKSLTDLFDFFTIAAVVDDSIFCVHGGLSPSLETIDQIRVLDRFKEVPHEGPLADMMWSDPDQDREGFQPSQRGAGYTFGGDIVNKFLTENNCKHIVRAHQLCMDGYQIFFDSLSTIWSAPNYCYRCGNVAAILEISDSFDHHYNTFSAAPDLLRNKPNANEASKEIPDYFL
eukprot:TRINITY_DN2219_c0_g1_i1.p1 TRINITY_DN2219_c0_g1~~TRINITY_DN2219_c0_g1_i1.p1  ORF type:complete len:310 (-),score=81.08 TRINITY_DN2219_c0_g1_i1:288-1217(-)